jgi:hypothetical protein
MEEKTMLGIAYILSLIPFISIVGYILLILGWIKLGNKYNEKLWKWVGYSAILAIIATVILFVTMGGAILSGNVSLLFGSLLGLIPVAILLLLYGILQAIGLWKAGNKFNSGLLKAGVISIIPFIGFIGALLAGIGFLLVKEQK